VTAVVYATQHRVNPEIGNYVDALYFTVTTPTTTGFGDITMVSDYGRLLAVLIMIFGISLFIRLAQTIFRPAEVRFACPECGLLRHDPDAVHCKHCGHVLNIPNEGD
jgi:voltage-gated potassium channel